VWKDPIVEEVREARDRIARRFGYDLTALVEYLRGKAGGVRRSRPAERGPEEARPKVAVAARTSRSVKAAIVQVAGGASKADVLAATGLSDGDWNRAVAALLDRGEVSRTGEKRGARYHVSSQPPNRTL
jgi:hypothetical protein